MTTIKNATDTFKELLTIYVGVIVAAATVFHFAEGRTWIDSVWWAFVTAMTVGYGDISPVTLIGRIDAVLLMHIVPLLIIPLVVVRLLEKVLDDKDKFSNEEQEQLKKDIHEIKKTLKVN